MFDPCGNGVAGRVAKRGAQLPGLSDSFTTTRTYEVCQSVCGMIVTILRQRSDS